MRFHTVPGAAAVSGGTSLHDIQIDAQQDPLIFQPNKGGLWIDEASVTIRHFKSALKALNIRDRRQYDTRHTYATMCLMPGMNPTFIANQLGHSVEMLLST